VKRRIDPNLSPEEREARIAELRARRRRRMRTLAIRSAIGTGVLVVVLAVALYWLLQTVAGRDVLLAQVKARLPAGATLSYDSAEGPLAGPLTLTNVHFVYDTIDFTAKRITLDPDLRPLLGRRLRLDSLQITDAHLEMAPSPDEPFELPRWPEVMPQIELPLDLQADQLVVDRFVYTSGGEQVMDISSLRGGIDMGDGYVEATAIKARTNLGNFSVDGYYRPGDRYDTDLTVSAGFPAPRGKTPARLGLVARGDVRHMEVAIGGNAPAPVRVHLDVRGASKPDWALRARSKQLDLALFGVGAADSPPLAFDLRASGTDGGAAVSGTATQGENTVVIEPSHVRIADTTLTVEPLAVQLLGGRVTLRGHADFADTADPTFKFAVNARDLQWGTGEQHISADADLGVAGRKARWVAIGKADLARGQDTAKVDFDGRGDLEKVLLKTLKATTPAGALDVTGQVGWAPQLSWDVKATLDDFDPGYFAAGWDGAVTGALASQGAQRDPAAGKGSGFDANLDIPRLGGRLRDRKLSGSGNFTVHGANGDGKLDLTLGSSHLRAQGSVADTLDIDADLSPLQLADLLPGATGRLSGTLKLSGARTAPTLDADLSGNALKLDSYAADTFSLRGRLPWKGSGGDLALRGTGVQAGLLLDTLAVDARGAVQDLELAVRADNPTVSLTLGGQARQAQDGSWSGALETLRIVPSKGDAWALTEPARFTQSGNTFTLSDSCLSGADDGSLCLSADWPRNGVSVHSDKLPLTLIQPWLAPSDGRPLTLRGEMTLDANLKPQGNAWQGQIHLASMDGGLKMGRNTRGEIVHYDHFSIDVDMTPQHIHGRLGTGFAGNGYVDATFDTGWDDFAPLSGDIYLYNDRLFWLELFSPDLVRPKGKLKGHVGLAGTRGTPLLSGEADLSEFTGDLPALGITLVDGAAQLTALSDGSAKITGSMKSQSATGGGDTGGTLSIDGSLGWQGGDEPLLFKVRGENFLASDTTELRAVVAPDMTIALQDNVLGVGGKVTVPSATINLEKLSEGVSTSEDVVVLDPADPEAGGSSLLKLDLAISLGNAVKLNGFGLDGTLQGDMSVHSRAGRAMSATGQLNVDGRYTAYGQKLSITRGELSWSNDDVSDPNINIRAEREVVSAGVTAGIDVTGRASAPHASVWSNPETSESDALAYLVLGRPLSNANSQESAQVSAASSALSAGAGLVASQLGAKIGLDDAGVLESRTMGASVFGVGKYLSPKLYVSYGVSMVGSGSVVTLKYLLRKGFNAEIESSTVETRGSLNWRKEK